MCWNVLATTIFVMYCVLEMLILKPTCAQKLWRSWRSWNALSIRSALRSMSSANMRLFTYSQFTFTLIFFQLLFLMAFCEKMLNKLTPIFYQFLFILHENKEYIRRHGVSCSHTFLQTCLCRHSTFWLQLLHYYIILKKGCITMINTALC